VVTVADAGLAIILLVRTALSERPRLAVHTAALGLLLVHVLVIDGARLPSHPSGVVRPREPEVKRGLVIGGLGRHRHRLRLRGGRGLNRSRLCHGVSHRANYANTLVQPTTALRHLRLPLAGCRYFSITSGPGSNIFWITTCLFNTSRRSFAFSCSTLILA